MDENTIMVLATGSTAVATVVLAIATLVYVRRTGEAVEAARDSAESARTSAMHAARAIDATERSTLAQAMPLLIAQWSSTTEMGAVTVDYTVHNVGKSTALNGTPRLRRDHEDAAPSAAGGLKAPAQPARQDRRW